MKYYVNQKAMEYGKGTEACPFLTIQEAADVAVAGDEVYVLPGVYREAVNPNNGGEENKRIVYKSTEPLGAEITGAEEVKKWTEIGGGVWTAVVSNELFADCNPYDTLVSGDWFFADHIAHIGDVYLNEKSLYEVTSLEAVKKADMSLESWDVDFSIYKWYAEVDKENNITKFYINFHNYNPNNEKVEISVRRNCFYPSEEGIGYITLSGFKVRAAATQWAPPTAYQEGMVGPHWSKGWIIEDCEIYESKCSGISLGKYLQPNNDNKWLKWKFKDGTQTERDCICQAQREGWLKEQVGSHIVRRCHIHDCGQTGIVGHLGGVFSVIEDNHIHNINNKRNLAGAEIGGIKMHAAIDVVYRRNHIHHCTRGLWLDWQAQGTRVTQNLFHDNSVPTISEWGDNVPKELYGEVGEDIFVEVSHGPTLIDNNILLSVRALKFAAQGIAVVHNLIGGSVAAIGRGTDNGSATIPSPRYTPYHVPHRTEVNGFMTILHGDDRFYNNIFIQQYVHPVLIQNEKETVESGNEWDDGRTSVGLDCFVGYQTFEEWQKMFEGYCNIGSEAGDKYYMHLPVWAQGNCYYNGAAPWEKESDAYVDNENKVTLELVKDGDSYTLKTNVYDYIPDKTWAQIDTGVLGMAFEPEEKYENPDGTPITFDYDYFGTGRGKIMAGCFAEALREYTV